MSIKARITLVLGIACAGSLAATAYAAPNKPPTVALTSPVAGASFSAPAALTLMANATDVDGAVSKVLFYRGTTLIGQSANTASPYSFVWNNVAAGTYSVTAKATDNVGAITTSTAVSVTVSVAGANPITITSPANGAAVYGDSVLVSGNFVGDLSTTLWVDNGNSTRLANVVGNTFSADLPIFPGPNTAKVTLVRRDKTAATASVAMIGNKLPVVTFLSPTGQSHAAPANVTFRVDAFSPTGSIRNVSFYNGATFLATVAAQPYQYVWPNLAKGTYTVAAKATDNLGFAETVYASVTVLGPNVPPSATLISPASGVHYTAPASIAMHAAASDQDGTVTQVDFLRNGVPVGTTNLPPYAYTLTNVGTGSYTLASRATDNQGAVTESASVTVTVGAPNVLPAVDITSPQSNGTFYAPANILLKANATDSDGTIAKVEFFKGTALIGTTSVAPYVFPWNNVVAGSYTLISKATDNAGAITTSAPVNIDVVANSPPAVALTAPTAAFISYAPASVTLSATASDVDGSVARVEFFRGTTSIGVAMAAPYTVSWSDVPAGTYSITAVATDNLGGISQSPETIVTIKPWAVTLVAPLEGAAIEGDSVLVKGRFEGPANTGVTVNDVVASIDSNNNFYAHILLVPGSNTITARVTQQSGAITTKAMTVTSDGPSPISIKASTVEGVAPLKVTFHIAGKTPIMGSVSVSGGMALVEQPDQYSAIVNYPGPGVYPTNVVMTDVEGRSVIKQHVIVVHDPAMMDQKITALWNGMHNAVSAGNKQEALSYLSTNAKDKFGPVFNALQANYKSIVATFSNPVRGVLSSQLAEYAVTRPHGDKKALFFIYYTRGFDGIWRLEEM